MNGDRDGRAHAASSISASRSACGTAVERTHTMGSASSIPYCGVPVCSSTR